MQAQIGLQFGLARFGDDVAIPLFVEAIHHHAVEADHAAQALGRAHRRFVDAGIALDAAQQRQRFAQGDIHQARVARLDLDQPLLRIQMPGGHPGVVGRRAALREAHIGVQQVLRLIVHCERLRVGQFQHLGVRRAQQGIHRHAEQVGGGAAGLHDAAIGRFDHQQHAVGLDQSGNMDRFLRADIHIQRFGGLIHGCGSAARQEWKWANMACAPPMAASRADGVARRRSSAAWKRRQPAGSPSASSK